MSESPVITVTPTVQCGACGTVFGLPVPHCCGFDRCGAEAYRADLARQQTRILQLILERDRWQSQIEQRQALRAELETALEFPLDSTYDADVFQQALTRLKQWKAERDQLLKEKAQVCQVLADLASFRR